MSALLRPDKLLIKAQQHDLSAQRYWKGFNQVLIAMYKHGSELMNFWTLPAVAADLKDFPSHIFTSSYDRNANVTKVIVPDHLVETVLSWAKHLKMSLEVHTYKPSDALEILYSPKTKKLKIAGTLKRTLIETSPRKIKVLIVDDSKVIRNLLKEALSSNERFEIVAESGHPMEVADLIEKHKPDVMTLDINMPQMNGVELIEKLGRHVLPATVVVSSLNMNEGTLVMSALENGAFDYIQKPSMEERHEFAIQLSEKLIVAADSAGKMKKSVVTGPSLRQMALDTNGLILIGASTGGTEAIKAILRHLPQNVPPILIVQHIPPVFSRAFAESLDRLCEFNVREAKDGDLLETGQAYVAPGGIQMRLVNHGPGKYGLSVHGNDKMSGHCPSVDCLFTSASQVYKGKGMAILLTGMGADGAKGLLELKHKKLHTVAQSEETCVVFGMPKQAIKLEATQKVIGLHEMAREIGDFFKK